MGVRVTIDPLNLTDDTQNPEWHWSVRIVVGGHLYENSDEHGNFTIERDGLHAFETADEAFHWAYRWLTSRGYDTEYIKLEMRPVVSKEFHRTKVNV